MRILVRLIIALANIRGQFHGPFVQLFGHHHRLDAARGDAPKRGEEHFRAGAQFLQHGVHPELDPFIAGGISDQHARQRANFHRLAVIAGGFKPGVFFVSIQELVGRFGTGIVGVGFRLRMDAIPALSSA